MKKLLGLLTAVVILLGCIPATKPQAAEVNTETIYLDNGDHIETTIVTYPQTRSFSTKTGVKTTTYMNADDEPLWSVSVTATFSYDPGRSCLCNSVSGESKSYVSGWKVSEATTFRQLNTAMASATGTKYFIGIPMNSYEVSVTLTCDTYGNLS